MELVTTNLPIASGKLPEPVHLEALAVSINTEHRACGDALRIAVGRAVRVGELLIEAKETVAHGHWGRWLADNIEFSERTAQAYMRVARQLPGLDPGEAQRVALLPLREVMDALASPSEPRREDGGCTCYWEVALSIDGPALESAMIRGVVDLVNAIEKEKTRQTTELLGRISVAEMENGHRFNDADRREIARLVRKTVDAFVEQTQELVKRHGGPVLSKYPNTGERMPSMVWGTRI